MSIKQSLEDLPPGHERQISEVNDIRSVRQHFENLCESELVRGGQLAMFTLIPSLENFGLFSEHSIKILGPDINVYTLWGLFQLAIEVRLLSVSLYIPVANSVLAKSSTKRCSTPGSSHGKETRPESSTL